MEEKNVKIEKKNIYKQNEPFNLGSPYKYYFVIGYAFFIN